MAVSDRNESLPECVAWFARTAEDISRLSAFDPPEPSRLGEIVWLEPYPDALFESNSPEEQVVQRETMSLAFNTALQHLPPRQRSVLVLRDVLGFHAREVAMMLDASEDSVASALKRARSNLTDRPTMAEAPLPGSGQERAVVDAMIRAYEDGDVDALVALLTDDVWIAMPPLPFEYYKLVPTRANGHPAFGAYVLDPNTDVLHAASLLVIALRGARISQLTRFRESHARLVRLAPNPARHMRCPVSENRPSHVDLEMRDYERIFRVHARPDAVFDAAGGGLEVGELTILNIAL